MHSDPVAALRLSPLYRNEKGGRTATGFAAELTARSPRCQVNFGKNAAKLPATVTKETAKVGPARIATFEIKRGLC